jgi:DNA-binding response OmpR family regulator
MIVTSNDAASEKTAPRVPPRILVVEDEVLIGMLIADCLELANFEVVGPATSVARALMLIEHTGCDAAVLDIRLGDSSAEPIADELRSRGTPFITLSGYAPSQRSAAFEGAPMLVKPVRPADLVAELRRCLTM